MQYNTYSAQICICVWIQAEVETLIPPQIKLKFTVTKQSKTVTL